MGDEQRRKRKSLKERFIENDFGFRLLIGVIFTLCLASFLHFREIHVEVLELNSLANKYVVAQVDFEYLDPEETIILKHEAITDVGKIYRIDEREIRTARLELEKQLISEDYKWPEGTTSNVETAYAIADLYEEAMLKGRFTDFKTLQKLREYNFSSKYYQVFSPSSVDDPIAIPKDYFRLFNKLVLNSNQSDAQLVDFVSQFFQKRKWLFSIDNPSQSQLIKKIQRKVPEKFTRVKAGTRIIDQGERVMPRHILMLQAMKKALGENRKILEPLTVLSSLLMATIITLLSAAYLYYNQKDIINSLQKLSLLVTIVILTLVLAKITELVLISNTSRFFDLIRYPILIPFSTILVCTLLNSRIALYTSAFLSIILAVSLAVDHSKFLMINLVTALVVIISTRQMRKRKEIFGVCFKAYLSAIPVLFAFSFSEGSFWSFSLATDLLSALLFILLTAILVVGLLPLLESIFRIMTDMSLMEYMDPNNELLRRLMIEAPGTYQHCLVLGNIAEAAARAINANGLFCRVATLYHDIGKMNNPHFFTENQQAGVNIHQLLTPLESSQVIISHVTDGEMLAKKYRLPQSFIDVIKEHHGTTLVYYFYCKEVELKRGDVEQVNEMAFRYPGPKPHSKESAIIMISDSVEAASRSLDEVNEQVLIKLINRIVADREEDGQLDQCQLTFEELGIVKKTLVKTMMITHHVRIKYPKKKE